MNPDAIPSKLKRRVDYPSVDHLIFPELSGLESVEEDDLDPSQWEQGEKRSVKSAVDEELKKEAYFRLNKSFLSNALTHVIFVKNEQLFQKMNYEISKLATRAVIFANGNQRLIQPGIDGICMLLSFIVQLS